MIDRREEITRVLVQLMGLANDWHVERPADVRDVVIIQSSRGPKVSVPVSFPDVKVTIETMRQRHTESEPKLRKPLCWLM